MGKLCIEKRMNLNIIDEEYSKGRIHRRKDTIKSLDEKLNKYREWLLSLTILDPACGSGAFLNQALDFLIKEHKKIDELRAELLGGGLIFPDITTDILEKNIYGVDLNEESVEIAKLSLWLRTAKKGRKLNTLSSNIKCGNSLIDDPEVAGGKAFNWQKEFPHIFEKKDKKAWHVTWVTHDTRTSQRMIKYKVRERRADGQMHIDRSVVLEEEDAIKVTEILSKIVVEEKLNCLAYNVCHDHIHMLLVCEEEELSNVVRKLKGKSAQKFKEYKGIPKDERFHLWAQKFNKTPIVSNEQIYATINYINHNREKHELPDINKGLQPLVRKMICNLDHAFRTEYKGGFDVVIGNPPYVRSRDFNDIVNSYFIDNYNLTISGYDLSTLFIEKLLAITNSNARSGLITSNKFFSARYGLKLREYLISNKAISEVVNFKSGVFRDTPVETSILIFDFKQKEEVNYTNIRKNELNVDFINKTFSKIEFSSLLQSPQFILFFPYDIIENALLSIIKKNDFKVSDFFEFNAGYGITNIRDILKSNREIDTDIPVYTGKSIWKYHNLDPEYWVEEGNLKQYNSNDTVLIRELSTTNRAIMLTEEINSFSALNSVTLVSSNQQIYLKTFLILFNSTFFCKLFEMFFESTRTHSNLRFKEIYLSDLPIGDINRFNNRLAGEKADIISMLHLELQIKKTKFLGLLKDTLEVEKISKKLDSFYNYDFKTFLAEVNKARKINKGLQPLVLRVQAEWKDFFEQYKADINQLQIEIDKTDKEIDQMVYELYGLTEEEIRIVEGN